MNFVRLERRICFKLWVNPPRTEREIREAMGPYSAAGVSGAFYSTDGVRVRIWSCSYSLKNQNVGKEGYPVRTFQVTIGYRGLIFACTKSYDGKEPDIKITEDDEFLNEVKSNPIYKDLEWEYVNKEGEALKQKGAWILVDNGYPDWTILQCPPKYPISDREMKWGKLLESLRKDVERVFGVLKQRFRVLLKFGITLQQFAKVERLFHACCALHNFILLRDDKLVDLSQPLVNSSISNRLYKPADQKDYVSPPPPTNARSKSKEYLSLRRKLIDHFSYKFDHDDVYWPRNVPAGFIRRRLEGLNDDGYVNFAL